MKRSFLMILLLTLIIIPFSTVSAFDFNKPGPHVMAGLMPDSSEIFAASRVGSDFIQELDAITLSLYSKLPESFAVEQPYTLDNTFRTMFAEQGFDWDQFIPLLGQNAAVGVEPVGGFDSGEDPLVIFVVEITDQIAIENFILSAVEDSSNVPPRETVGDNIVYKMEPAGVQLIITPTHLVFTNHADYSPDAVASPLSNSAGFTGAMSNLVADSYSGVVYVSEATMEAMMSQGDAASLQMMGVNPSDTGAIAIGFTILAGNTFTFDMAAQTTTPMATSTVNLDFLNSMPGSTDLFIVATDLTNVYRNAVSTIQTVTQATGEDDPTPQIPVMFNFTGLDLEDEVLSWTTGSYGIFLGADFIALMEEAFANGTITSLDFDAGIVIEATDVALAQNAAATLGQTLTGLAANEETVTVTQTDINGVAATSIVLELPMDPSAPPLMLELVLTATDDFFFFGTRSALDTVMSGDTLAANADFSKSTQYFLENPTSVFYTNSDGVVVSTIIPLAIMGPAIGNVFEEIVAELDADSDGISSESKSSPSGDPFGLIMEAMNAYDDILSSMTMTTSVDAGGVLRIRGTISVNP